MYYQPTPITWQNFHFLIMSSPDNDQMKQCIKVNKNKQNIPLTFLLQDLKRLKVKLLVRTCEKTYDETPIKEAGIDIMVST